MDRKTLGAAIKFGLSICGILYALFNASSTKSKGECPPGFYVTPEALQRSAFERIQVHRGECFFPANYEDGSKRFLEAAMNAGADVSSMMIGREGLKSDVAIFRHGADPNNFLVHLSGTHGPEGYVGSAIQNAAMQYIKSEGLYQQKPDSNDEINTNTVEVDAEGVTITDNKISNENQDNTKVLPPTLVFVHAVNPYGFKYHRRVNEDNVDLNRNFLSSTEWEEVHSLDPNYARHIDLQDVINPTSMPFPYIFLNDLYLLLKSGISILKYGKNTIKTALVAGNYINQKGYSYGGQQYTQSTTNLMNLLINELNIPNIAKKFILIDVHSGLGPSGIDTLLDVGSQDPETVDNINNIIEKIFPTEYNIKTQAIGALKSFKTQVNDETNSDKTQAADEVSKGYEIVKGVIAGGFCNNILAPNLNGSNKLCVTQVISFFLLFYYNNIFKIFGILLFFIIRNLGL